MSFEKTDCNIFIGYLNKTIILLYLKNLIRRATQRQVLYIQSCPLYASELTIRYGTCCIECFLGILQGILLEPFCIQMYYTVPFSQYFDRKLGRDRRKKVPCVSAASMSR